MNQTDVQDCIDACNACADACEDCAAACLKERDVTPMARCIELNRECAHICRMAAGFMERGSSQAAQLCVLCAKVCRECAAECSKHPMRHCQQCAAVCLACAAQCESQSAA